MKDMAISPDFILGAISFNGSFYSPPLTERSGSLLVFLAFCVTISCITTRRNRRRALQQPWPVVPGALPFIGNSLGPGGISNFFSKVAEWVALHGTKNNPAGLLECSVFGKTYYIVCNNNLASKIINLRSHTFHKNQNLVDAAKSVGADGIFVAEGARWKQDRRLVAPAFNRKAMMDYLPHLQIITGRLIAKWKQVAASSSDRTVPINHDLSCLTVDNIGRIAFGVEYDSLRRPDSQEAKDIQLIFNRMYSRSLSPFKWWKLPIVGQYLDPQARQVQQRFHEKFSSLIEQEQTRLQTQAPDGDNYDGLNTKRTAPTFLSKIVNDACDMPLHRLHGNLQTMLIAGSDTTSSVLMVSLFKIASDQTNLQEELLREAILLPGLEQPLLLTLDALLDTLPRTRSLFYEVVRYMGPAPQLMCQNKVALEVLPGVSVPAGSRFLLPLQYLGTQPGSGIPPGPCDTPSTAFCARRWCEIDESTGIVKGVHKPSAKMGVSVSSGFGGGIRICPGQVVAEVEAILCIAYILREFRLSLPEDHAPIKMMAQVSSRPSREIRLILNERVNENVRQR
jgi:cytochrome P450